MNEFVIGYFTFVIDKIERGDKVLKCISGHNIKPLRVPTSANDSKIVSACTKAANNFIRLQRKQQGTHFSRA